jgi:hypothetical protein
LAELSKINAAIFFPLGELFVILAEVPSCGVFEEQAPVVLTIYCEAEAFHNIRVLALHVPSVLVSRRLFLKLICVLNLH